jgi:hypothetical protein
MYCFSVTYEAGSTITLEACTRNDVRQAIMK